jgi:hypothetical protein
MTQWTKLRYFSSVGLALFALIPASLLAQKYVYVNNNVSFTGNSVSAFSVSPSGILTAIAGSPFSTGGNGGGALFAANELAISPNGQFLFAANGGSITVFSINKSSGMLTIVGSPVTTGQNDCDGISLAEANTTGGDFLYATNSCTYRNAPPSISVFSIGSNGVLTPTSFSPVAIPGNPDGINVRPDGKFLAVGFSNLSAVAVYNIGFGGSLSAVPGSPFPAPVPDIGHEGATGVDYKCGGKILFAGIANLTETVVDSFDVASNGALGPLDLDPFTFGSATVNSNVVLFSPFGQLLFVSNQESNTVTDFRVAPDGSLTPVPGAPFVATNGPPPGPFSVLPTGMAVGSVTDPVTGLSTAFLYVVSSGSTNIAVFSVANDGTLTLISGSPFGTGASNGQPVSVVAYPPLGCSVK